MAIVIGDECIGTYQLQLGGRKVRLAAYAKTQAASC